MAVRAPLFQHDTKGSRCTIAYVKVAQTVSPFRNDRLIVLRHHPDMCGSRFELIFGHELRLRGEGTEAAILCGGRGQGAAVLLRSRRP
jgi:hypothetical protein